VDWIDWLRIDLVEESCEYSNEYSDFTIDGKYLIKLNDYPFLVDSGVWSQQV
jgi:hypothetical protein